MKCLNCGHEMLITETFLTYWKKWLCPKCNYEFLEKTEGRE
jgi:transposase-like protein